MDAQERISFSIDWDKLLAEDGSLPFISTLPVVSTPAPKRAAVAPRPRKPIDTGIEVQDMGSADEVFGIIACAVVMETHWQCPICHQGWRKPGKHSGQLKQCHKCKTKFFLRHQHKETDIGT